MPKKGEWGFKKGESGNPGGRPKLPEDLKDAQQMSLEDAMRSVIRVRSMSLKDAKKVAANKDGSLSLGEYVILDAYLKRNYKGIEYYESRLWGRVKETIDFDMPSDTSFEVTIKSAGSGKK